MDTKKIFTFLIHDEVYCVDVNAIASIDQAALVTEMPLMPPHVTGVVNHRGQIVPIIDLRILFDKKNNHVRSTKESCFVFLQSQKGKLGCVVDKASDVIEHQFGQDTFSSDVNKKDTTGYVSSVFKVSDVVHFLLNADKLYESISEMPSTTLEAFEKLKSKNKAA